MKKRMLSWVFGVAILIISLSIAQARSDSSGPENGSSNLSRHELMQQKPAGQEVKVIYTCSMHPSVTSEKPGKCPTCGMNLVKKDAPAVSYTCPMDPGVTSEKPGKCPKCGMNLEKKEITMVMYTCPMDPEVKSDKPGKCPKCGMNLEKKSGKKEDPKK